MLTWLNKLRGHPAPAAQTEVPGWACELQDALHSLDEGLRVPPEWATELLEATQKLARAQAKQGARVESLESRLDAGFTDLRSRAAAAAPPSPLNFDDLLDALDALDAAVTGVAAGPDRIDGSAPLAAGLRSVGERVQRFVTRAGLQRLAEVGAPPDGRYFRVVGEVCVPGLPKGVVARVVRAAVLQRERVLREGEVLINRRDEQ